MVIFWVLAEVFSWEAEDLGTKQISALNGGEESPLSGDSALWQGMKAVGCANFIYFSFS